jgi:uroporphyrinogen-III decarboxylase
MKLESWERFKKVALGDTSAMEKGVLCALIADSPWIPGVTGVKTLDYFTQPEVWIRSNLWIEERFPEVVFLPGYWMEYGMGAEPSAFGCRMKWWKNSPPSVLPSMHDISEVSTLKVPDPEEDGLMPLVLNLFEHIEKTVLPKGSHVKMVAARGPLATASHLRGVTELLLDLKIEPEKTKQLIEIATETAIRFLQAQIRHLSEVEGILLLDDIVGFLSPADYMEFAHPYLKAIFNAFDGMVKVYHNDAKIIHIVEPLAETGLHVLNFGFNSDMGEVWKRVGRKIRLMGNIPTFEILAGGTPEEVKAYSAECIRKTGGGRGLILSAGGAAPPATPAVNVDALAEAARGA